MFDPDDKISGGCLTAGHKVVMSDGTTKNIEDIKNNDLVVTMYGTDTVTNTVHFTKEVVRLTLENGKAIEATNEHRFLVSTDEGQIWKTVEDLRENDEILKLV